MSDKLKSTAVHGIMWSAVERFSVQAVQFVVTLVMARLLSPTDYGLIGMLTIFIALSQTLIDSGFSQALIRKQDRTEVDNSTVFYFNIVVGFALYVILYASAPFVADFYNEPQLCALMRVVCIGVIINSLAVVQRALLTVKVDFKTQAKASLVAAVVSGIVGISLAFAGLGVWALAVQQLLSLSINTLLLWLLSHWKPIWAYSWKSFRELFSFGSKMLASGILDTTYNNIYQIVIGKVFSASSLGHYTRAHQFATLPSSNITGILQRVSYPVLCQIQDDDERLAHAYRKFLKMSAFVVFPMMTLLAGLSPSLVPMLIGEKWAFCAQLLTIICFSMMWYPIHAINLNLLQVKGRSDLFLRLEIIKKILGVAVLCISLPFGLVVMCYASIVTSLIALVINTYYTGRLIHVGFWEQMRDLVPTLLMSISVFVAVYGIHFAVVNIYLRTMAGTIVGVLTLWFISNIFHFSETNELKIIFHKQFKTKDI